MPQSDSPPLPDGPGNGPPSHGESRPASQIGGAAQESTFPPASEGSAPAGAVFRGIPGSPGVAVGPALVIGDSRAVYTRRHVHAAQVETVV